MNELEEAFEEALGAREEAVGEREKVTFRSARIDALIGSQLEDYSPGMGGEVDNVPIRVSVRKVDVRLPIKTLEAITVRGKHLNVLTYEPLEGRVDIMAGTPEEEMR